MPKGHSTLEPRIAALEASHKQFVEEFFAPRIANLEKRIMEMQDAFNRGVIPSPYTPQFKVFPGANPNSNGS